MMEVFPFLQEADAAPARRAIARALRAEDPPAETIHEPVFVDIVRAVNQHFAHQPLRALFPALASLTDDISSAQAGTRLWNALQRVQRRAPTWDRTLAMSIIGMRSLRGIGGTSTNEFLRTCIRLSVEFASAGRALPVAAPGGVQPPDAAAPSPPELPPADTDGPPRLTHVLPFLREPRAAPYLKALEESFGEKDPLVRSIIDVPLLEREAARAIVELFPGRPLSTLFPGLGRSNSYFSTDEAGTRLWNVLFKELGGSPTWAAALIGRSVAKYMGMRGVGTTSVVEFLRGCVRSSIAAARSEGRPDRVDLLPAARDRDEDPRVRALVDEGLLRDEDSSAEQGSLSGTARSQWFAETREDLGVSTLELARETGISEQRQVDWEFGRSHPTDDEWYLIRAYFAAQRQRRGRDVSETISRPDVPPVEDGWGPGGEQHVDAEPVTGAWLARRRARLGWSKGQVANALETHTALLDLWELEVAPIPDEYHERLRHALSGPPPPRPAGPSGGTKRVASRLAPSVTVSPPAAPSRGRLKDHAEASRRVKAAHDALAAAFKARVAARGGVVYALEHGLEGQALEDVVSAAAAWLKRADMTPGEWRDCYLPLLVAAAEAAYGYDGPGTEYWSLLEARVGFGFDGGARQRLQVFFELAAQEDRFAYPPSTPWAERFQLIAWPITHAVLSRDIHRALGQALAQLELPITSETPAEAVVEILSRNADRLGGRRFEHLVKDSALITGLVKEFLGLEGASGLEPKLVRRLLADLRADTQTSADIDRAQARQRRRDAPPTANVALLLDVDARPPQLLVQLPATPVGVDEEVRAAMAAGRYAPSLWGVATPIRLDRLVSGAPVRISLRRWPPMDAPVITDLASAPVQGALRDFLASLSADLRVDAALFARASSEALSSQVSGAALSADDEVFAVMEPAQVPPGVEAGEPLADRVVVALGRADSPSARGFLQGRGVAARGRCRARVLGAPTADSPRGQGYLIGDVVALRIDEAPAGATLVTPSGEQHAVNVGALVRLTPTEPGATFIRLQADGTTETQPFFFSAPKKPNPVVWTDLEGPQTLRALRRRELALKVSSMCHLESLGLTATLSAAGRQLASTSVTLGSVPTVVAGGDRFWAPLVSTAVTAQSRGLRTLELRLVVGHLSVRAWQLEDEQADLTWREGALEAVDNTGAPVQLEVLDERSPVGPALAAAGQSAESLKVGYPRDRRGDPTDGRCIGPSVVTWDYRAPPSPRLRRSVGDGEGALGLETLSRAYVAWATAECADWALELRRRDVVAWVEEHLVEVTCGQTWARLERALREAPPPASPAVAIVEACRTAPEPIGFDNMTELTTEEERQLLPRVAQQIAELPDVGRILLQASAEDIQALNGAFERVYHELSRATADGRRSEELRAVEISYRPEHWASALEQARGRLRMEQFTPLLWPTDAAIELLERDYRCATLSALGELLADWSSAHLAAHVGLAWSREEAAAVVALWVDPGAELARAWPLALERMVADRGMSRAARYVALRCRAARMAADE